MGGPEVDRLIALLAKLPGLGARYTSDATWTIIEKLEAFAVLKLGESQLKTIEEELFGDDEDVSRRIFALQREVIDLGHATAPVPDMLTRLQRIVENDAQAQDDQEADESSTEESSNE